MGCYKCGGEGGNEVQMCTDCRDQHIAHRRNLDGKDARGRPIGASETYGGLQKTSSGGRAFIILLGVVLLTPLLGIIVIRMFGNKIESRPTVVESVPVVSAYLKGAYGCDSPATIKIINVTNVGSFHPQLGGYPVFGDYAVNCIKGGINFTWNGSDDRNSAIVYIRRNVSGALEAFKPDVFKQLEGEFEREMNKATKQIEKDFDRQIEQLK